MKMFAIAVRADQLFCFSVFVEGFIWFFTNVADAVHCLRAPVIAVVD